MGHVRRSPFDCSAELILLLLLAAMEDKNLILSPTSSLLPASQSSSVLLARSPSRGTNVERELSAPTLTPHQLTLTSTVFPVLLSPNETLPTSSTTLVFSSDSACAFSCFLARAPLTFLTPGS